MYAQLKFVSNELEHLWKSWRTSKISLSRIDIICISLDAVIVFSIVVGGE